MTSVDVIVPCFNYGEFLDACVTSVLTQDNVDVRVLIMDDASTDETPLVAQSLALRDSRVQWRRHAHNVGHLATYNEALDLVSANYCVIISADDMLTAGSLSRATRFLDAHPEVGFAYGRDLTFRGAPPRHMARTNVASARVFRYFEFLDAACHRGDTGIQAPTVVVRSVLHRAVGGYRLELPHSADTELWLRLAAHSGVAELDADQAFRRLHASNMSLRYSPLNRLEAQVAAFDAHFREQWWLQPEIARMRNVLHRTIAEAAFWQGSQAFAMEEAEESDAFMAFAARLWPDIDRWGPWRRFRWKRRLGPSAWRVIEPVAERARVLARGWRRRGPE
jgi:glycosyltransferase involved in cell wall biosynthesis